LHRIHTWYLWNAPGKLSPCSLGDNAWTHERPLADRVPGVYRWLKYIKRG
jgi:hypothetical protein